MEQIYDVIIIGGGPAGLSAGLYAGRGRVKALIIEQGRDGGQIASTDEIENYPGQMLENETGTSLVARMTKQVEKFGVKRVTAAVKSVELEGNVKSIITANETYKGYNIIIATGAYPKPIGCKGESEFIGRGVSYCATCDANFFEGLEVFVVGGGDSAVEEAIYLTKFARKVTIIHRRDELRAAKSIQEKAFSNAKIEFLWNSTVEEVYGEGVVQGLKIRNVITEEVTHMEADATDGVFGVFGFIGTTPHTSLFEGMLNMQNGYIKTDENMHTNLDGVYAVGDVRVKSLRQVVTAVADGAIAAVQIAEEHK